MQNTDTKRQLFKTATAILSCALFKAGERVAVKYDHQGPSGTHWFEVTSPKGVTVYPETHLKDFVL